MKYPDFLERFEKKVKTTAGYNVICPAHADRTPSLQVCCAGDGKILLKCFAGCTTEAVVGALGLKMSDLFPDTPAKQFTAPTTPRVEIEKPVIETIYSYQNQVGTEVYQVVRLKPKSFRQRHMVDGKWIWSMEGVERVLYHLPEVIKSQTVWAVEGEKDADNLDALGFVATCNVGGAGKWLDAYTEILAGKDVVICGDNDKPGEDHVKTVFDSICGTAKSVKILKLPKSAKDVSDFINSWGSVEKAKGSLQSLMDESYPFVKGHKLPLYTMAELEPGYQRMVLDMASNSFSLGSWLPTLGRKLRPLIPGELVFIIGDTGVGKTGVLSEIARCAKPLPALFFELELPAELLFERSVAAKRNLPCADIEASYRSGDVLGSALDIDFKNLLICTESKLTLHDLENYIVRSELKLGVKPKLVLLDYLQLIGAQGPNRREKVSDVAEGLKILAKSTKTIIICASQVHRPDGDEEIHLHSAKESGSIENSCGLLLGLWRDKNDPVLFHIKVLKSTKGGGGLVVECLFTPENMRIREKSIISE